MTKKVDNGIIREMTADEQTEYDSRISSFPTETDFERSINIFREKRNSLLTKTDWTASSDLVMSDEMKTYRQQLRDATEGLDTVEKIEAYTFPTEVTK
jgi:hypothetical protein